MSKGKSPYNMLLMAGSMNPPVLSMDCGLQLLSEFMCNGIIHSIPLVNGGAVFCKCSQMFGTCALAADSKDVADTWPRQWVSTTPALNLGCRCLLHRQFGQEALLTSPWTTAPQRPTRETCTPPPKGLAVIAAKISTPSYINDGNSGIGKRGQLLCCNFVPAQTQVEVVQPGYLRASKRRL